MGICLGLARFKQLYETRGSSKAVLRLGFGTSIGVDSGLASIPALSVEMCGFDAARSRLLAARVLLERDFWCFFEGFAFFGDTSTLDVGTVVVESRYLRDLKLFARLLASNEPPPATGKTPKGDAIFGQLDAYLSEVK